MSDLKYLKVKKYVEYLNEIDDIDKLSLIYEIVKKHECKITITKTWILCSIDYLHEDCINEILYYIG